MTDRRLRELERDMAQGDAQAAEQWVVEWTRAGNEHPRAGLVRVLSDALQPRHFVTPCCQEPIAIGPSVMDPSSFTWRTDYYCFTCLDHGEVFTLDSYLNAPFGWVANKRAVSPPRPPRAIGWDEVTFD